VLWHCWLGGRKGIRPAKTEWWGAGMVICLERGADLHMAQLMPLSLAVSCFSRIQIGFTFLVPAHTGSPGKRAVKQVCVYVCYLLNIVIVPHCQMTVNLLSFSDWVVFYYPRESFREGLCNHRYIVLVSSTIVAVFKTNVSVNFNSYFVTKSSFAWYHACNSSKWLCFYTLKTELDFF